MDTNPTNPRQTLPEDTIDESAYEPQPLKPKQVPLWLRVVLALAVVGVGALVVVAMIRVSDSIRTTGQPKVKVWFDLPPTVISGSEMHFTIVYENQDSQLLRTPVLNIIYPQGFRFSDSVPDSQDGAGRSFSLPELLPGGTGKIEVSGIFTGSPDEVKLLRGRMFFQLKNTSSTFTAEAQGQLSVQAPNLNFRISASTDVVNAQAIDYILTFQNISDEVMERVQLNINFPDGFRYESASQPPKEPGVWQFGRLAIGDSKELKIYGFLTGTIGEDKKLNADLGYLNDENEFILQSQAFVSTRIMDAPILITQEIDGEITSVDEGETLNYRFKYENIGTQGMHNVRIFVTLDSTVIDFTTVRAEGGAFVKNQLIWNAAGVPKLSLVQPGQSDWLQMSFRIKPNLSQSGIASPYVRTSVFLTSEELPEPIFQQRSEVLVRTRLTADAGFIYDSGANPPQPGLETTYRVTLKVRNSVNDVSDASLQAVISTPIVNVVPDSVVPATSQSAVGFTPTSGRFTWQIGNIKAFTTSQISFLVTIVPSISGSINGFPLIKNIEVVGHDDYTSELIPAPPIDSLTL